METKKYVPPSIAIGVRVTPAEYQQLEEKAEAAGLKPGRFAVAAALGLEITPPVPACNRHLYADLARVGANLNQISARLNSFSKLNDSDLVAALGDLSRLLAEVRRQLLGVK